MRTGGGAFTPWKLKQRLFWITLILLSGLSGCAGRRSETNRYTEKTLPHWIVEEWSHAQDEMLKNIPDLKQDPRRFSPYEWEWIQFDSPFIWVDLQLTILYGITLPGQKVICICCGRKDTVRHEAFHAILWKMQDPRYVIHYPDWKE